MRHHVRFVAILAACLCAYGVLLEAFRLLNRPSNSAVLAGTALILGLLLLAPLLLRAIWRRL